MGERYTPQPNIENQEYRAKIIQARAESDAENILKVLYLQNGGRPIKSNSFFLAQEKLEEYATMALAEIANEEKMDLSDYEAMQYKQYLISALSKGYPVEIN